MKIELSKEDAAVIIDLLITSKIFILKQPPQKEIEKISFLYGKAATAIKK